jgi:hypothetical protein
MSIENLKLFYALSCVALFLIILSPTLTFFFIFTQGEPFSQLWILGPNHTAADYPLDVMINEDYLFYVGVSNHLGHSSYYVLYVKLANQDEPLPNTTAGIPSPLTPLTEYRLFIQDEESWGTSLKFSLSDVSIFENQSLVKIININNVAFNVDKLAPWSVKNNGYYYRLIIELWIYNSEFDALQFHNRFVSIRLNVKSDA